MLRTVCVEFNDVAPIPATLRETPSRDSPASQTTINLGQLFLHHYLDSYPIGAPSPDPSRFEYLQLVSDSSDFRFHPYVADASTLKKRAISAEIGQAFCRLMLHDHFGIVYFAHLAKLINRPTHPAFEGLRIIRTQSGDIPDYLCARKVTQPVIAEAKGRFKPISFGNRAFASWRDQFSRIRVLDRAGNPRKVKGYIVATRFATAANASRTRTTTHLEDPATEGDQLSRDQALALGRVATSLHYASVLERIGLNAFAAALSLGYALTTQLTYQVPVWSCLIPPFERRTYLGGYYRTQSGRGPVLTDKGWQLSLELGTGHAVFVGVELSVALQVVAAARGAWSQLDDLPLPEPVGLWNSDFAWLLDGTVAAPAQYFAFVGFQQL